MPRDLHHSHLQSFATPPTSSHCKATRSYPTRWGPMLGENGKRWISKCSRNNITQILLHIKDYDIWNSFSLTAMRLLPKK